MGLLALFLSMVVGERLWLVVLVRVRLMGVLCIGWK
jgi:hypothetical protein